MKKTTYSIEKYFMEKFEELGIEIVLPSKGDRKKRSL